MSRYTNMSESGFGNLVDNPKKISGANSSTSVVVICIAVNSKNTDKDGRDIERAVFRQVKLFGFEADNAMEDFSKGDRVHYAGAMFPIEYENRKGEIVEDWEINADRGQVYLAPLPERIRGKSGSNVESHRKSQGGSSRVSSRVKNDDDFDDDFDEDILGDDFDEDEAPRRPQRRTTSSRTRGGKRKRSVQVDDDVDDYDADII